MRTPKLDAEIQNTCFQTSKGKLIMAKFALLMLGEGIQLENSRELPEVGFILARFVKAKSPADAEQLLKITVLKEWKQYFNRANNAGTPALTVVENKRIFNPFRRLATASDFGFFSTAEEKDTLLAELLRQFR